MLNLFLH